MYKNTMHPEQPFLLGKLYSKMWEIECRMTQREAARAAENARECAPEFRADWQIIAARRYEIAREIFERNT